MEIFIPEKFFKEKQYIVKQLFSYIDLPYFSIKPVKGQWYLIRFDKKCIKIKDAFFSNVNENSYLNVRYLPQEIYYLDSIDLESISDIIYLFGESYFKKDANSITLGADIFASAFYFLTRWEVYVIKDRDEHSRFPDSKNILLKNSLHYRPVVCEYVQLLIKMLQFLGLNVNLNQSYNLRVTHDVDLFSRFGSFIDFAKGAVNDILRRKSLRLFNKTVQSFLGYKFLGWNDPYNTFDFLMDSSEKVGVKSEFYFIPSQIDEPYTFYDYRDKKVAEEVKHII